MQDGSKPSGGKDTGSLSGRFHRARFRLTLTYVLTLALLLFISSGSIYSAFSQQVEHRFERFRPRPTIVLPEGMVPPRPEEVRADLIRSLLLVNGCLLLMGGIFSYYLAGLTLEPIQAAYDRQRRFLSDASHELRTPLAILQMNLENEQNQEKISPEQREQIKDNLEEVMHMGQLVNDLLVLSRLDEKKETLDEQTKIAVYPVIKAAIARLQKMAQSHQVTLQLSPDEEPEVCIKANEEHLLRILTNLLQNAIIYNKTGGSVQIALNTAGKQAAITIVDTGIGISELDLAKIFERFYRTDKSRSRQTGGSGLGLAIVQSLVTRLQGSIGIKSTLNVGTTVELFFPLVDAS